MHKFLFLFFLFAISCNFDNEDRPDVSDIEVNLAVTRLEQQMFALKDKESLRNFLKEHETLTKYFFQVDQYPHDSVLVNSLFQLINDPHIDTLYTEAQEAFGDFSEIESQFVEAFKHIKYYYPDFKVPKIQTVVTGFGRDLFVSDSLVIIGLDYYIGEGATYRPLDIPNYILKRYEKEYIVPSYVLLISSHFNQIDQKDQTMLADMLFYGKAYHFADQILADTPDSVLLGYTSKELADVTDNQKVIWAHFVENQLLYETSYFTKKKYLEERPKTLEIGNKAPGRIGVWLGWEIIKRYMRENPEVTLPELMQTKDAQRLFNQSKYKPGA